MTREIIRTADAAQPIGPYSQAVLASGKLLFASGQIPIDAATGQLVTGDIQAQTRTVLNNVRAILAAAGATFGNVVKSTVFLADMNDFPAMNAVYQEYFGLTNCPARSTIQVARLPKDAKVEIEVVAAV
jgi:2-iminobutanoate/2-iminopropanoate deaminase